MQKISFNGYLKDHGHSLWHSGVVLTLNFANGYAISLHANGQVHCELFDDDKVIKSINDSCNSGTFAEEMSKYIADDEELDSLITAGAMGNKKGRRLYIVECNWWEALVTKNGKDVRFTDLTGEYATDVLNEILNRADEIIAAAEAEVDQESNDDRYNICYLQPRFNPTHEHMLWYGSDVCQIQCEDDYVITLGTRGTIDCDLIEFGETTQSVLDEHGAGRFAEKLGVHIRNDTELETLISAEPNAWNRRLDVKSNNHWEATIMHKGFILKRVPLTSTYYNDAIREIIANLDAFTNRNAQHIYVYHEYNDGEAYGSQHMQVFYRETDGLNYLKSRVESQYEMCWENIERLVVEDDDEFRPDYVSIHKGNSVDFFILEKQPIN